MAKENPPAISVIIPLFNAEAYVAECLTSLANQTLQNFEVLVVDDCSTDNSRAVVKSFAPTFGERLRLTKLSKNSGCAGIPRNFALKSASGKYVYFLDSDDLLTENALEELFDVAEKFSADVVHAEKVFEFFDDVSKAEIISFQAGELVTEPILETFDVGKRVDGFIRKKFIWWACNKLFSRKFLLDNKITFPATKIFEDFIFVLNCLAAAQNYVRVPFVSYCYRKVKDSLSHSDSDMMQFFGNVLAVVKSLDDFISGNKFFNDNPRYKYSVTDFFVQERLGVFANDIFIEQNHSSAEVYDVLCKHVFSANPKDNVALTSYLFVTANILRLYVNRQAAEISELKRQSEAQS